ncbi:hypothetical protein J19TS2_42840 [Cohnella xylanilytica]|uniref:hypothetical protein n=1 Tax=Cohnella xylanilytica TaxID=557555 RepID=UPI001B2D95C0|nr:hypothetical protein [Cohnella xylanilytica]GIO14729.1 hypothetical protein J19TS2_42840 [Cohnella xylanilytica]
MLPKGKELQAILDKAADQARKEAKQAGASIYYIREKKRIRESADGQKYEILIDDSGNRIERILHEQ